MTPSASFFVRHKIAIVVLALVAAGGGAWYVKSKGTATDETRYVLATVEKGTVVVSVAGSGQVSTSNQVDVKPKASGDIVTLSVKKGQEVKAGALLAQIDAGDALKAVRDAQANVDAAKLSLEKLQQPSDALSILQAENSLASSQRAEQQAEEALAQLQASHERDVATAYDDGYNAASDAFLDMPNHMKDLKDLRGTDASPDENVKAFKNILGENSPLITAWTRDHDAALARYDEGYAYFKTVTRTSPEAVRYELISRTLNTENAVSQALQSAHAMLDAVVNTSYKQYTVAKTVDAELPLISSDISEINGDISSTQKAKDALDAEARDYPVALKKAQDAIVAAKETVGERTESLAAMKEGVDPLDLKSQELTLRQRENSLRDAREKLADYAVRAPFDGIVADVPVRKGDAASPSTVIATFITKQSIATVSLNEVDAAKVKVGQKVTLTFDAVEGLSLTGSIIDIDALGTVSQGVVTYDANIGLDGQDERVKPGMSVSAAIITDLKTDVLTVPNSAIKSQGGATYVEMLDLPAGTDGSSPAGIVSVTPPRRQPVEIGLANDEVTEIVSGLSEGDKVVSRTILPAATSAAAAQNRSILQTGGAGRAAGGGAGGNRTFNQPVFIGR
ncbi:MAG TPA: efflux RND transporter periplasmic adaptor subunit [Candidatus Eisenbacteria bacterium]|nr:efflux RND transporter periplasmic adaptor subunit [Candidatus Eisenbacteria bacterium]